MLIFGPQDQMKGIAGGYDDKQDMRIQYQALHKLSRRAKVLPTLHVIALVDAENTGVCLLSLRSQLCGYST